MRITMRVDGTVQSKLDRCLALSSAFKENEPDSEIYFFSSCTKLQAAQITEAGFTLVPIEKIMLSWDAESIAEQLEKLGIQMMIIDKEVDLDFIDSLRKKVFIAIFDESESAAGHNWSVDAIINTRIDAHLVQYKNIQGTELLLGTDFIPLSKSYDEYTDLKRENPESGRKIILYFQEKNKKLLLLAVRSLKKLKNNFSVTIISPEPLDGGEELASELGLDSRFNTIIDKSPARRIASADILVTEPSCIQISLALSIPTIILSNDISQVSEYAARSGFVISIGRASNVDPEQLAKTVADLASNKEMRDRMSLRMAELVDGLGRYRLADELLRLYRTKKEPL